MVGFQKTATGILIQGPTVGMSGVVLGVAASAMVGSTAYTMPDASPGALQTVVAGLMIPLATTLLLVVIFAGPRWIADFSHFLGFAFGGAIEAIYVFDSHGSEPEEVRTLSSNIGR